VLGVRHALQAVRSQGKRIALVPTMGYLHEGHLSLVDRAREVADVVVMSIFVNPLQFGPSEDLARYPRDLARDSGMAEQRGVDVLFVPTDDQMYPGGRPAVTVVANELTRRMEGAFRPGHFEGVLTVVAKLFNIVQPDSAVFGQKDFQQCVVVTRMCSDLNMPVAIEIVPTVREADGLAMSSRNVYLSRQERQSALLLPRSLRAARALFAKGERNAEALLHAAHEILAADAGVELQYVELVEPTTLESVQQAASDSVMALAAKVGKTRLIDNMRMGG
jgi:pantoate--beta-alanine ligase